MTENKKNMLMIDEEVFIEQQEQQRIAKTENTNLEKDTSNWHIWGEGWISNGEWQMNTLLIFPRWCGFGSKEGWEQTIRTLNQAMKEDRTFNDEWVSNSLLFMRSSENTSIEII